MQRNHSNKARAFNPFLRAGTNKMKDLIGEVQKQVEGYEHFHKLRKRARKAVDQATFERTLEAIVCDLCVCVLQPEFEAVHLPLSNKVLRKKSRYKSVALGKTLPDILHVLTAEETTFVGQKKGTSKFRIIDEMMNVAFAGGVQTTIWAEHKLLSRIERFGVRFEDIQQDPGEEAIILRAPKDRSDQRAMAKEYKDTADTLVLRAQLTDINTWLANADLYCDLSEINTQDRYLRRIFNNSDFAQGGRLYGGFWQRMSSQDRQENILIDGDCVVELDYGQMSLAMLYGIAGKTPPEGDLYDLSAFGIPTQYRIPALFGAEFNTGSWQQGIVKINQGLVLLTTINKKGLTAGEGYHDKFLSDTKIQWQSQNRTTQTSNHADILSGKNLDDNVYLFVRFGKLRGGKAAPFLYVGQPKFLNMQGEKPITFIFNLSDPLPQHLHKVFLT